MSIKFSGHEVIEMAIQIEQKGYDFYKLLEDKAKRTVMKNLFHWLADEEKKHIQVFENLRETFIRINVDELQNWEEASLYFKSLVDTKVFPANNDGIYLGKELEDEIGAIHIAISFEKDNILYFQEIRDLIEEKEKKIINKLINEEKNHIMKLIEIKKKVFDD